MADLINSISLYCSVHKTWSFMAELTNHQTSSNIISIKTDLKKVTDVCLSPSENNVHF